MIYKVHNNDINIRSYYNNNYNMSFLMPNNAIPYQNIAEEFCKAYYNTFASTGSSGIMNLYAPDAIITFAEDECVGQIAFNQKLTNLGISKMTFAELTASAQPHGQDIVLINVSGQFSIAKIQLAPNWMRFTDVFILQKFNESWFIIHHIFKVIK